MLASGTASARSCSLVVLAALAALLITLAAPAPVAAAGIERNCPRGQIWDPNKGACARKKVVVKRSPEESYYAAIDQLEGKGGKPDAAKAAGLLVSSCGRRHAASCTLLGFLYRSGRGVAVDPAGSLRSYATACKLGDPDGCVGAADIHTRGLLGQIDNEKAVPLLEQACAAKHGPACYQLAGMYNDALGVTADANRAGELYAQAFALVTPDCAAKNGPACYTLGLAYADGHGVELDTTKAFDAFEQGCAAGSGDACYRVAAAYDVGTGVAIAKDHALTTYDRACRQYDHAEACFEAGVTIALGPESGWDKDVLTFYGERACTLDPKNCDLLGHLYGTGKTGNEDQPKAGEKFRIACEHGKAQACYNTGLRLSSGTGVAVDATAAVPFHERACDGNHAAGCLEAGRAYYTGTAVAQSDTRAFELFSLGCLRDDAASCLNGGWVLENNRWGGEAADPARGALYYEEGCRLGDASSCTSYGRMLGDGTGIDKNPAEAIAHWVSACDGVNGGAADGEGCERLGRAYYDDGFGAKDLLAAGRAFERACAMGRATVCYWLDQTYREAGADDATKQSALATLETGCAAETPNDEACLALGGLYASGGYLASKNGRRAFQLYDGLCKRDVAVGCAGLAFAFRNGTGVVKNPERAKQIFTEQCDAGTSSSCTWLAVQLGEEGKHADAAALYERACEEDDATGCNQIGFAHYTSKGTQWDVVAAEKAYARACELGSAVGCANVGELYQWGVGREPDLAKAREFYERGCTPTDSIACGRVGVFYEKGLGGATADKSRAEESYRRACEADPPLPEACHDLAGLYAKSGGADAARVAQLEQRAFDAAKRSIEGNPYYQYVLGTYHRDGVATVKSPEEAGRLFVSACDGYDPVGCLAAGEMYLGGQGVPVNLALAAAQFQRACAANVSVGCTKAAAARGGGGNAAGTLGPRKGGCACDGGGGGGGALEVIAVIGLAAVVIALVRRRKKRDCCG